jgi:hypothetical protein
MKESKKIKDQIDKLLKSRNYSDRNDFDYRCYLNEKIEKLSSQYELQLNKECGC